MPKKTEKSEWSRKCPNLKCNKTLYYSSKRNLQRAVQNDRPCNTCRVISENQKKQISNTLTGHKCTYHRGKGYVKNKKKNFFKECPSCNEPIGYTTKDSLNRSLRDNTVCNPCSAIIYKKSWQYRITDDHTKQMRATKAGFSSWEEYLEKYPEKKQYKAEVVRHTYRQPLDTLENYDRRGKMGVEGAWQIDHIISVDEGYKKGIPPEKIGDISNLQMLPWRDNLKKSNSKGNLK